MSNYRTLLGIVSVALFLVTGGAALAIAARNSTLDSEGRHFVAAAIPAIFTNWNERALISRASTELRGAVKERDLDRLFGGMSRNLGRLQSCQQVNGNATISMDTARGIVVTGDYVARAKFKAGRAEIRLSLIRKNGNWRIQSFRLNSDRFGEKG